MSSGIGPHASAAPFERIRSIYERLAPLYDRGQWITEALLLRRLRRDLITRAPCRTGCRVLEVGIGTGTNLAFYPPASVIYGVDLCKPMLERAMARAHQSASRSSKELLFKVRESPLTR